MKVTSPSFTEASEGLLYITESSLEGSQSVISTAFSAPTSFYHHSVAQYLPKSVSDVNIPHHAHGVKNPSNSGHRSPAIRPLPPRPASSHSNPTLPSSPTPAQSDSLPPPSPEQTVSSDQEPSDLSLEKPRDEGIAIPTKPLPMDELLCGSNGFILASNMSSSSTPSLSSSITQRSPGSISSDSCLPTTPSSSSMDNGFGILPRGPRPHSFSNEPKNPPRGGSHRRTLSAPNIHEEVEGAKNFEWTSNMENESAIDWYSKEFSDTITVGSQLPLSMPARPESISFAPRSPALNTSVRIAKPLPSIPALRPNRGKSTAKAPLRLTNPADVRSESKTVGHNEDTVTSKDSEKRLSADAGINPKGAGVSVDNLEATGHRDAACIRSDESVDDGFKNDQPHPPVSRNDQVHNGARSAEIELKRPPPDAPDIILTMNDGPTTNNLPLPLPHDSMDLELEITTHLEELSSHPVSLSPARPDTPTDSMYGEVDHKHLRSRWSVSTLASVSDDERGFFRGSAFLRFNFRPQKKSRGLSVLM
jgi:hypothetical protein